MRCEDLTRELASPTGAHNPAEIAGHLANCPACAEWSRQAARFDQIWEATRPIEPSPLMMDALWANVSTALEAQPASSTLQLEGLKHRRTWLKPALLLAQAAALLLAVGFVLHRKGDVNPVPIIKNDLVATPAQNTQTAQTSEPSALDDLPSFPVMKLDVSVDEMAFVRIPANQQETPSVFISTVAPSDHTNAIPAVTSHDLMNSLEQMADRPVVITSL